ncbi:MAG TPA: glycosyltransferase family 4 protein [Psychromonas sp.]
MRLKYIVNGISKTSIPWRWSEYFNKHSTVINIQMLSVKDFRKKIFEIKNTTDIVHGHHIKAMVFFLVANILLRKRSVYTVHGSYLFLSKVNAALLKFIFKYADRIIFVNKMLYDVLPEEMKKQINDKCEIILNGVETDFNYAKTDVYKKFNIDAQDTVLFHPARFVPEKNHLRIIAALKSLVEQNSKIKLVLAGDGKLKKELQKSITDLKLEDNVIMIGLIERDEVYNFLERCDLFLMPSVSEGLNIAFLEAISMHCKILVSNIEQFVYPVEAYRLIPDELNVTFVDPLDEKEIASGILSALDKEQNYTYDCADFSLKTMMNKYESIYRELLRAH